jgi:hypothetical protein
VADIRKAATWNTAITYAGKTVTLGVDNPASRQPPSTVPPARLWRKYLDLGAPANGAEAPDYLFLRYADVLMGLAEAINSTMGRRQKRTDGEFRFCARAKVPKSYSGTQRGCIQGQFVPRAPLRVAMEMHGLFDNRRNPWAKARVEAKW